MKDEQIKAIAKEVAHLRAFDGGFFPHEKEIREDYEVLLQWLNTRYCIVEKDMVKDYYAIYKEVWDKSVNRDNLDYQKGAMVAMEDIFGESMFNQNEE